MTSRQRRLDRALRVNIGGKPRFLHVEWTTELPASMNFRVFEYHCLSAIQQFTQLLPAPNDGWEVAANLRVGDAPAEKAGPPSVELDVRNRMATLLALRYEELELVAHRFEGKNWQKVVPALGSLTRGACRPAMGVPGEP